MYKKHLRGYIHVRYSSGRKLFIKYFYFDLLLFYAVQQ